MKDYTPSNSELLRHYQFKLHKKEKVIVDKATQCEPNKPGPSSSESKQTIISEIDMSSWIMTVCFLFYFFFVFLIVHIIYMGLIFLRQ